MNHAIVDTLIQEARGRECAPLEQALLEMNALPVPWAWIGCFGIRANGDVVYVNEDGKPESIVYTSSLSDLS